MPTTDTKAHPCVYENPAAWLPLARAMVLLWRRGSSGCPPVRDAVAELRLGLAVGEDGSQRVAAQLVQDELLRMAPTAASMSPAAKRANVEARAALDINKKARVALATAILASFPD